MATNGDAAWYSSGTLSLCLSSLAVVLVIDGVAVSVIGGGARSQYWGRILAAALNRPLLYRKNADVGPALGAARLAQMGGNGQSTPEFTAPPIESEITPNADDVSSMGAKLERFRRLYHSTKDLF